MTACNASLNISSVGYGVNRADDETSDDSSVGSDDTEDIDNYVDYEVISESVDKNQTYMQTDAVYDSAGNYVVTETDESGRYDVTGKDAWWIQSPSSANGNGHTSLLIQEKPGYWWYFYWGDKSIQLLFIGTTSLKDIDKNVRNQINYYNKHYSSKLGKINYYEKYTQTIKFSGNFKKSITEIKNFITKNQYSQYYEHKHIDTVKVKYSILAKFRYTAKYKGKERPYSYILSKNKFYVVITNNCLQASIYYLKYGNLTKNDVEFKKELNKWHYIPNDSIKKFKKFGKWATL